MTAADGSTLDRKALEALQVEKLRALLADVIAHNPFYSGRLEKAGARADLASVTEFVSSVPFTYRWEMAEDQASHPPYGSNLTYPLKRYTRFSQTSGTTGRPMRWLDTQESWSWMVDCWTRVYRSAGVGDDDRVFFPFSFGPFLGFWVAFEAAAHVGGIAISGGGMRSTARLQAILDNQATVLCSTPSYALHLAEVARDEGIDLSSGSIRKIIVAGEPGGSIPATRALIERMWPGASVFDHHGLTEIGPVSYECPELPGTLHIMEAAYLPEVIDPANNRPVAPGGSGELVLTNLGRLGSPLLRYRTGDMVRLAEKTPCRCGSSEMALTGGILARSDDMVIVRGVNVYPSAVEEILRSCDVTEFRVEVDANRSLPEMKVQIEPSDSRPIEDQANKVATALLHALGFRVLVTCALRGTLPRFEGKAKRWVYR